MACLLAGRERDVDRLAEALARCGFAVRTAPDPAEAQRALEREPLAAVYVAGSLGAAAVARLVGGAAQRSDTHTVVLGASETVQEAVDAMQIGAADYLPPPLNVEAAVERLRRTLDRLRASAAEPPPASGFVGLIGGSPAMRKLYASMDKVARYKTNVLVLGESGTGKELIARALHDRGPRRQHLFVPVNCATLGREILENELFGHERGAFTGANERKKGLFEMADGGTFFLDEIAEMNPATQAKLLRVLERSEFRRVGGTGKVKVDVNVIAATNKDLDAAIGAGRFRDDLYYRLKVVTLVVPPLRHRKEDIPALVEAFIADFNRRTGGGIRSIAPRALGRLMEYDWPGNVRELRNAMEGAAVLAGGDLVGEEAFDDLLPTATGPRLASSAQRAVPAPGYHTERGRGSDEPERRGEPTAGLGALEPRGGPGANPIVVPLGATLAEAERQIILAQLARCGTKARTARALGIGLRTLYTKLRAYGALPGRDRAETA